MYKTPLEEAKEKIESNNLFEVLLGSIQYVGILFLIVIIRVVSACVMLIFSPIEAKDILLHNDADYTEHQHHLALQRTTNAPPNYRYHGP